MTKIFVLAVLCLALGGCAVATAAGDVVGAGVSIASTAVSTTADVAGSAVGTVTGSSDKSPKN